MLDSLKQFVEQNLEWACHEPEKKQIYMMCAFGAVHMYCCLRPDEEPMVSNWWNNSKREEFMNIYIDNS